MNRRLLLTALAVVLALTGTSAVFMYVGRADARALSGQETVQAYLATKPIPMGTTAEDAESKGWLGKQLLARKAVPEGALLEITPEIRKQVALTDISAGELVMNSRLGSKAEMATRLSIPAGKMAVSIELEDPARVGGFVDVGSEIAIFDTYNTLTPTDVNAPAGDGLAERHEYNRSTKVLLPRVTVLAVGQTTNKDNSTTEDDEKKQQPGTSATPTAMVTVAVTQQEAEKLVHGIQTGHLYFALLTKDSKVGPGKGVDNRTLFK